MNDHENLKDDIKEIKETVKDIFKVLNGNGATGLVTIAALNRSSIRRLWWAVGIASTGFLGCVGFLFGKALGG